MLRATSSFQCSVEQLGPKFGVLAPKIDPYYNQAFLVVPMSLKNSGKTFPSLWKTPGV